MHRAGGVSVYAIIETGGKQYRVSPGDTILVERLATPVGEQVTLEDVRLLGGDQTRVGTPRVDGAAVLGTVIEHSRDRKVRVFKYKRRKHYRRTRGHRQAYTAIKIDELRG
jgi:large subunit ribosomal protein L21